MANRNSGTPAGAPAHPIGLRDAQLEKKFEAATQPG